MVVVKPLEPLQYNQVDIKDLKTGDYCRYTIREISWTRDNSLTMQNLSADHQTINQQELWIARLHESTDLEDTELRKMSRRTFETLVAKWLHVNDMDQTAFLGTIEPVKKE